MTVQSEIAGPCQADGHQATRPFRICACLSHFHPTIGGAELQLLRLAREWIRLGAHVHVITRSLPGFPAYENLDGIQIHRTIRTYSLGPLFGLTFIGSLSRQLKVIARDCDVVLAWQGPWEAVATGWVKKHLRGPSLMRIASTGPNGDLDQLHRAKGSGLWKRLARRNTRYIAQSQTAREELLSLGVDPAAILSMTNAVDLTEFSIDEPGGNAPEQPSARNHDRAKTALFVGRLTAAKNPVTPIQAWSAVVRSHPDARLLIAGDGPLRGMLEEQVRQDGIKNVTFLGEVQSMPEVYRQAALFIQSSPQEGCSNALLEAMAMGLCPVVSRVPGNVDLVEHNVHGRHVEFGSAEKLAETLIELMDSPQVAARLAAAARRSVEEFHSLTAVAKQYWELFHELARTHA